ncbi:AlpA family phage regulatory protein [Paraglaciecola aquimarina]|uniref:AlpA family phage regulatory protein n=1 Tax=Paraglaciecola aquimarina TaxID=1235557 RepID=A0ABU3SV20_9ALTE|nr:AlpA family phage regulatory protein [Paraglaciecola aquimarina]MDU0353831.1 AlpA family phage regulatory protein [Paraglaciecola aquimarina]
MNNQKQILSSKELAKLLGVSRATLWRMRQENLVPQPIQISVRLIGWERHVIDAWLKERREQLH